MKLLAAAFLAAASVTAAHAATRPPARLQVVAREYSYTLSRLTLKAGPALIELDNFGEDRHDLRVQRAGARHVAGLGEIAPGSRATLALDLPPGRYSFWCSVADHRARGMRATLTVSR
ncbi:MAG TPA: cupredoxin domain-containing protein [Gaiellaceae bacterium]|nr:cupredoxin domain-containing protein [Gaiellaceae bacterium]